MADSTKSKTEAPPSSSSSDPEVQDGHGTQISRNTGWLKYVVDYVLGDYHKEPIWQLRLLATVIFAVVGMFGCIILPKYLNRIHETYQIVTAITIVGAPVVVAAISLFVSFWLPSERKNWIIGLLVVNISLFAGVIVVYLALQHGIEK